MMVGMGMVMVGMKMVMIKPIRRTMGRIMKIIKTKMTMTMLMEMMMTSVRGK